MSFNGSGTFNLATGNPVVTGTTISSTWANNTLSDIATGLSNCITRDGQSPATANIPMGSHKLTGLSAGTTAGDSARYEQVTSAVAITGGAIDGTPIGGTTPAAGAFTTLSASSTVSGTGFSTYLASPPAIGGTTPAAITGTTITANTSFAGALNGTVGATTPNTGAFTTLSASSTVTLSGGTANGVLYLNGSKVATSGSALTFDGTNLGLGVTPSAWGSAKAMQLGSYAALAGYANEVDLSCNSYFNGSSYVYLNSSQLASYYAQTSGKHIWYTAPSGTAGNAISFTQAMTLDESRNLLVGTTSAAAKLTISADTNATTGNRVALFASTYSGGDSNYETIALVKYANSTATSNVFAKFYINAGAAGCGQINANGANAAAFGTFSDSRLKENITELPSQLNNILSLKPCEFDYKDGSGHQIGFIAQEMQEVYPDVVGEGTDGMLTITGWSKTEARLAKAIQELKAELDELKSQLGK